MTAAIDFNAVDSVLRRDPGQRGVVTYRHEGRLLCAGELESAAHSLAERGTAVAIVTGFCVFDGQRPAAETDGPPGALYLARAFASLGLDVKLIGDSLVAPALRAGCDVWGLAAGATLEFPFETDPRDRLSNEPGANQAADAWTDQFLASDFGRRLSHVIAVERAGPSHTSDSASGGATGADAALAAEFERAVPPESRNLCHNMRGESINAHTAKTHRLFELVHERRPDVVTLGLADGGNEIGMGAVSWNVLRRAIRGPGELIACRIATSHTLLAGVSNWAAYALALAVCRLRNAANLARSWDVENQRQLIETLVREVGLVDGVTRRRSASVDGIAVAAYLQTLERLRELML